MPPDAPISEFLPLPVLHSGQLGSAAGDAALANGQSHPPFSSGHPSGPAGYTGVRSNQLIVSTTACIAGDAGPSGLDCIFHDDLILCSHRGSAWSGNGGWRRRRRRRRGDAGSLQHARERRGAGSLLCWHEWGPHPQQHTLWHEPWGTTADAGQQWTLWCISGPDGGGGQRVWRNGNGDGLWCDGRGRQHPI